MNSKKPNTKKPKTVKDYLKSRGKVPQFVEKQELENKFLNQEFSKLKEEDYPLGLKI